MQLAPPLKTPDPQPSGTPEAQKDPPVTRKMEPKEQLHNQKIRLQT